MPALKRFLVFAYTPYDAAGGWGDFISSHDTLPAAIYYLGRRVKDGLEGDIVDSVLGMTIEEITRP